jgi:hypothetical protein
MNPLLSLASDSPLMFEMKYSFPDWSPTKLFGDSKPVIWAAPLGKAKQSTSAAENKLPHSGEGRFNGNGGVINVGGFLMMLEDRSQRIKKLSRNDRACPSRRTPYQLTALTWIKLPC